MPDPVLSDYPTLAEQSTGCVNMHHSDLDCLNDFPYHPTMTGYNFCHKIMAKDQKRGGKSFLDDDIFYSAELK